MAELFLKKDGSGDMLATEVHQYLDDHGGTSHGLFNLGEAQELANYIHSVGHKAILIEAGDGHMASC